MWLLGESDEKEKGQDVVVRSKAVMRKRKMWLLGGNRCEGGEIRCGW
jgi:hypothetical protein